jgi:hypothetical protein
MAALSARFVPLLERWFAGRFPQLNLRPGAVRDMIERGLAEAVGRMASSRTLNSVAVLDEAMGAIVRAAEKMGQDLTATAPLKPAARRDIELEDARTRYREGLARLDPMERLGIVLRIELQSDWEFIAGETGSPSVEAARSLVVQGLLRLAGEMRHVRA